MIRGNHRRAAGRDEIAEQPQLCIEVMRDIRMIIHVVARQIGKAAGGDAHAVEPVLVEPVRRGLEREMGDALARDLVELLMQRDRVRRGQRAVDGALWRNQPDGADAGGGMAKTFPDLPRERGDRGLAAGAGHRRYCRGLPRVEFRRRQRQRAARIWCHHERHAAAACRMVACDRHCACGNRGIDKARTVGLAARQRKEQVARLHRAAVDGNARYLDRIARGVDRGIGAKEVAKSHAVPVRPAASSRDSISAVRPVDY